MPMHISCGVIDDSIKGRMLASLTYNCNKSVLGESLKFEEKKMAMAPRDHHFGMTIHPEALYHFMENPHQLRALHLAPQVGNKNPFTLVGKNGFQVSLDVQQFLPNEITIKAVDNVVTVEGKHEEKPDDHGYIARNFVRKYTLPNEIDCADLVSTLSSDGILTLKAHKKADGNKRTIHIQHTGPARHSIKPN